MPAIEDLIQMASVMGVVVDHQEARYVLLAKKILARDPNNPPAKNVVKAFAEHLRTKKFVGTFDVFDLVDPDDKSNGERRG